MILEGQKILANSTEELQDPESNFCFLTLWPSLNQASEGRAEKNQCVIAGSLHSVTDIV